MTEIDLAAIEEQRARIRTAHLRPADERPPSSARGPMELIVDPLGEMYGSKVL